MLRATPNTQHPRKWAMALHREMQMAIGQQLRDDTVYASPAIDVISPTFSLCVVRTQRSSDANKNLMS